MSEQPKADDSDNASPSGSGDADRVRMLTVLGRADAHAATTVTRELLDRGTSGEDVLVGVLVPTLSRARDMWLTGRWSPAREKAASHTARHVVDVVLSRAAPPPEGGELGRIAVCSAQGDDHGTGTRVLAACLAMRGWDALLLPDGTGTDELFARLPLLGADVLALGCATTAALPGARAMTVAARAHGVPVLAGGSGFGDDGRWAAVVGAHAWAGDPADAAQLLTYGTWPAEAVSVEEPDSAADVSSQVLLRARGALVEAAFEALGPALPPGLGHENTATVREGLTSAVGSLAGAVCVEDPAVFEEATAWLAALLSYRGVRRAALRDAYAALDKQVALLEAGDAAGVVDSARRLL